MLTTTTPSDCVAGALCQTYKRHRALQPLPGLHIACHSALAAEASSRGRHEQGQRPSEGTTPAKISDHVHHARPSPDPALFHGSPVHRQASCFEPFVTIGSRRLDAGPGPSVLANCSSSVLTPVETCTNKLLSQNTRDAAGMVFHDASQKTSLPSLPTGSLRSSITTLRLASLEVDPSCSSLLDHSVAKELPVHCAHTSPSARPVTNILDHPSPCLRHPVPGMSTQRTTPCPTIITDGSNILEVSPRSLVTPRKSQAPPELSAQHAALRKENSIPFRTTDSHLLPSSSYQGVCRYRRRAESPSDDEGLDSPALPGGLLTPQCMATVSVLQCMSPAEHQSTHGSADSGSAGRLVCNLIDRFNNTQLYDGINESPQLDAAQLVCPEAD